MTNYQRKIQDYADECFDPRHVEAWMRVGNPTLDRLSEDQFRSETIAAVDTLIAAGAETSERLAKSLGL